jgi:hypothetical protein
MPEWPFILPPISLSGGVCTPVGCISQRKGVLSCTRTLHRHTISLAERAHRRVQRHLPHSSQCAHQMLLSDQLQVSAQCCYRNTSQGVQGLSGNITSDPLIPRSCANSPGRQDRGHRAAVSDSPGEAMHMRFPTLPLQYAGSSCARCWVLHQQTIVYLTSSRCSAQSRCLVSHLWNVRSPTTKHFITAWGRLVCGLLTK